MNRCLFLLCLVVLAAGAPMASARQPLEWHRATVAIVSSEDIPPDEAAKWADRGVSALLAPAGESDAMDRLSDLARSAGIPLLVARAADSSGVEHVTVAGAEEVPFSVRRVRLDGLPSDAESLEMLFAGRARSADSPAIAPLAVPGGATGALWYLLPGPVAVPRSGPDDAAAMAAASFRAAHPAVAGGIHALAQADPYAFYRAIRLPDGSLDHVLVVTGARGRVRLNVATWFDNDTVLRDAATGRIAIVNFGYVTFEAGDTGLVLIEEYR